VHVKSDEFLAGSSHNKLEGMLLFVRPRYSLDLQASWQGQVALCSYQGIKCIDDTTINLAVGVLAEDKLFATLDPTTRRVELAGGQEVLFTDTVGECRLALWAAGRYTCFCMAVVVPCG